MGGAQVRWGGVGEREMSVQAMGEMGKNFCPKFRQTFLETLTEGGITTETGSLFQYFTTITTSTLEYLLGVPP